MAILVSVLSVVYGIDKGYPVFGFIVPILSLGLLLLYVFRDKEKTPANNASTISKFPQVILILVSFQTLILLEGYVMARSMQTSLEEVASDVDSIQSDVSSLESDVGSLQSDVSSIESKIVH